MTSFYDVDAAELVQRASVELKKISELKQPECFLFVKTGNHKQRPPQDANWWYVRVASVLRKVALLGPIGSEKLRAHYGGKKNRGYKPEKYVRGSGSIARHALQGLEKAGLIKKTEKNALHKGRVITPKGISLLSKAAAPPRAQTNG